MRFFAYSLFLGFAVHTAALAQPHVEIRNNQLVIDGQAQPQLFGAELQYFRLRGAYGRNVPRATVIALWNKALDRMVEAKMNAVSFYIPWDFHEYAEGKFDFTGSVDEDGDGNPDYPSRDVVTFFRLIREHGIHHIMVRPGPYINAEWGFLGFGAIPEWFHNKYPESHMQNSLGLHTKLYDYHNPDLLRHTQLWFKALYEQVLRDQMGEGKPIDFLQIDNETNFQWQSLYNADYGAPAIARYQQFLFDRYRTIEALNRAHNRSWKNFSEVKAPTVPGVNRAEDQDWYRFQDWSIYTYLGKIRSLWEDLGVKEPQVLFTLAESYNAAGFGLLPHYIYRNSPGSTGMMTTNVYPKTFETLDRALHNQPFKIDLDVLSADEANDLYLGRHEEWVLGPEIQGGWWRGISVSPASRLQTYLSGFGHGLKALFVYYFNEGYNFGSSWAFEKIKPIYDNLRVQMNLPANAQMPQSFWTELQKRVDHQLLVGFDARSIMQSNSTENEKLYFDAPLDENANPRNHFAQLKSVGEQLVAPYGTLMARSTNAFDSVAIVKDSEAHVPTRDGRINNIWAASDWSGGLLGYFLNAGISPRILHGDISPSQAFLLPKLFVHLDTGLNSPSTVAQLKAAADRKQGILNFMSDAAMRPIWADLPAARDSLHFENARDTVTAYLDSQGQLTSRDRAGATKLEFTSAGPYYSYDLRRNPDCEALLYRGDLVVGYDCKGRNFTQIGALLFDDLNSSNYANSEDLGKRRQFLTALAHRYGISQLLSFDSSADHFVAFARKDPQQQALWITAKSAARHAQAPLVTIAAELLPAGTRANYEVRDLMSGEAQNYQGLALTQKGFAAKLASEGSTVFLLKAKP